MTMNMKKITLLTAICTLFFSFSAYANTATTNSKSHEPLWRASTTANKIVVISDIHIGIDDKYAETVKNRPLLVEFLQRLQKTRDVRELVIDGDFLDEWMVPASYPAHTDSAAFYDKVVANNPTVINELKNVMASGIKLVYVPGNHDLLLEKKTLDKALPGIIQARDVAGLGTYYTGDRKEIVIEHGHRYDVFSSPDNFSNKELTGSDKAMLPAGYFYARVGETWVAEGMPAIKKNYPVITTVPDKNNMDQLGAYAYYKVLSSEFARMTPKEGFTDKMIDVRIGGFNGRYSIQDMYPVVQADGTISAPVLFKNLQRNWPERQKANLVKVNSSFYDAASGAIGSEYFAEQAKNQYLQNPNEKVNVVVFGHTHIPYYHKFADNKIYVNDGTWIDINGSYRPATRTFVIVTTGKKNRAGVYQYMPDGKVNDITATVTH